MSKEEKSYNKCSICGRPPHKESEYCIFHASAEEKTEKEFKKALKEYVNKIKEADSDYVFYEFIFVGEINFKKDLTINIFKKADFSEATFEGYADFSEATFKGHTNFYEVTFRGGAGFREVTFEENAVFQEVTFEGDTGFKGTTFKGHANFKGTTFGGHAYFKGTTFKGHAYFYEATFEENADFSEATFKENAVFRKATFEVYTYFYRTTFKGHAYFKGTTFKGHAYFKGTTFKGDANLKGATFRENVSFGEATFEGDVSFGEATFEGDVSFGIKTIKKDMIFSNALFTQGKTLEINTLKIMNKVVIKFDNAYLENVYLELILGKKTLIYFNTKKILQNYVIKGNQIKNHILQEECKEFVQAKEVYLRLKNNFHSIGRYEDENWAFKKEKDMERKSNCHFKTLHRWIWACFLNGIFGYGIQPFKVIMSAILIITLFAFLFMTSGISNVGIEQITSNNFFDCMYFSTITFTTLGYGDFRPLEGWGRILAGSEAFIGAFMMALFVYTFARRTGGR